MRRFSKKLVVVLTVISVIVFSCDKSDLPKKEVSPDIEAFLGESTAQYKYSDDEGKFTWKFQFNQYQILWFSQGIDGDPTNPIRHVGFRLISENNENYFEFSRKPKATDRRSHLKGLHKRFSVSPISASDDDGGYATIRKETP